MSASNLVLSVPLLERLTTLYEGWRATSTPTELAVWGDVETHGCDCGGGCRGSCSGRCGGCGGSSCKGGFKIF